MELFLNKLQPGVEVDEQFRLQDVSQGSIRVRMVYHQLGGSATAAPTPSVGLVHDKIQPFRPSRTGTQAGEGVWEEDGDDDVLFAQVRWCR